MIDLPRDVADEKTASKPLGTIQVPITPSDHSATYNFYASVASALKGKAKKTQSSADSQLIAMASETAAAAEEPSIASGHGAASELESLKLLVPAGEGAEAGKLVLAPVKVSRCFTCRSPRLQRRASRRG